jgi:hypothetical protein
MKTGLSFVILILIFISLAMKVWEVCGNDGRMNQDRENYKRVCTIKRNPLNLNQVTEVCEGSG